MPGGDGDGLRLQSDVLIPAGECTSDDVRGAALRDELRAGTTEAPCARPAGSLRSISRRMSWPTASFSG